MNGSRSEPATSSIHRRFVRDREGGLEHNSNNRTPTLAHRSRSPPATAASGLVPFLRSRFRRSGCWLSQLDRHSWLDFDPLLRVPSSPEGTTPRALRRKRAQGLSAPAHLSKTKEGLHITAHDECFSIVGVYDDVDRVANHCAEAVLCVQGVLEHE